MKSISLETIVFSLGFAVTPCKLCGFCINPLSLQRRASVTMSLFPLTGRLTHKLNILNESAHFISIFSHLKNFQQSDIRCFCKLASFALVTGVAAVSVRMHLSSVFWRTCSATQQRSSLAVAAWQTGGAALFFHAAVSQLRSVTLCSP